MPSASKNDDLDRFVTTRSGVEDKRKELRDKHCKGPGKPEDYRFVVSSSCRPKPGTKAAAEAAKKKPSSTTNGRKISPAQNLKELKAVANFLRTEVALPLELNAWNYSAIAPVFGQMVDKKRRMMNPDPMERYKNIVQSIVRESKKMGPNVVIKFDTMPRHLVFMQYLAHLQNLDLPSDTPRDLLNYRPEFGDS